MTTTVEKFTENAKAELAGKPSIQELAARISRRKAYDGPAVAAIVRQDRDAH